LESCPMRAIIKELRQKSAWSWAGWRIAWKTESALRGWAVMHGVSVLAAFVLPLSAGEVAVIVMGGTLVLVVELLNTAIERVVDYISLDRHPLAGEAKDIASCAVSLAGVAVGLAWVVILMGLLG